MHVFGCWKKLFHIFIFNIKLSLWFVLLAVIYNLLILDFSSFLFSLGVSDYAEIVEEEGDYSVPDGRFMCKLFLGRIYHFYQLVYIISIKSICANVNWMSAWNIL